MFAYEEIRKIVFLDSSTVKKVKTIGCKGSSIIYNNKKVKKFEKIVEASDVGAC
jgi:hypothetical protein